MEKLAAHARTLLRRGIVAVLASGAAIGLHAVAAGATKPANPGGTTPTVTTPAPDDGSTGASTTTTSTAPTLGTTTGTDTTTDTTPTDATTPTATTPAAGSTPATSTTPSGVEHPGPAAGSTPSQAGAGEGHAGSHRHLPPLPPPSSPRAGVSVTLRPAAGVIEIKLPGAAGFRSLPAGAELPVGTVIDASAGKVVLTSAVNLQGATKSGTFTGGRFVVQQVKGAHPLTKLRLTGGSFAGCPTTRSATVTHARRFFAVMASTRRRRPHVIRQLWGSDHGGSFVSIARGASAAVRGTVWLTQDLCGGTLITVKRGMVLVHDFRRHRDVVVRAGHSYLARVAR